MPNSFWDLEDIMVHAHIIKYFKEATRTFTFENCRYDIDVTEDAYYDANGDIITTPGKKVVVISRWRLDGSSMPFTGKQVQHLQYHEWNVSKFPGLGQYMAYLEI